MEDKLAYNRPQNSNFKNNFNNKKRWEDRPKDVGLQVHVNGDGPEALTKALRRLKKKLANDGILQTLRDKQYYQKPSEVKREKKKQGIKRWKKLQRENERKL
jgi:small subunit ribosomal protein S21